MNMMIPTSYNQNIYRGKRKLNIMIEYTDRIWRSREKTKTNLISRITTLIDYLIPLHNPYLPNRTICLSLTIFTINYLTKTSQDLGNLKYHTMTPNITASIQRETQERALTGNGSSRRSVAQNHLHQMEKSQITNSLVIKTDKNKENKMR